MSIDKHKNKKVQKIIICIKQYHNNMQLITIIITKSKTMNNMIIDIKSKMMNNIIIGMKNKMMNIIINIINAINNNMSIIGNIMHKKIEGKESISMMIIEFDQEFLGYIFIQI